MLLLRITFASEEYIAPPFSFAILFAIKELLTSRVPPNWSIAPPNSAEFLSNIESVILTTPPSQLSPSPLTSTNTAPPFLVAVTFINSQSSITKVTYLSAFPPLIATAPAVILATKLMNFDFLIVVQPVLYIAVAYFEVAFAKTLSLTVMKQPFA